MTNYFDTKKWQSGVFVCNMKRENILLRKRLGKYRFLLSIKESALELAVSKFVDTCRYCRYAIGSNECKKFSCERGMKKYFREIARKNIILFNHQKK